MDGSGRTSNAGVARVVGQALLCLAVTVSVAWGQVPPPPSSLTPEPVALPPHMPASVRDEIRKVVVISGRGPAEQEVTGSYERATAGLVGGIQAGSRVGTISKEIGGVPVSVPIPGLALPGAILGGLTGLTRRQIQEFRDRLTEEITNSDSPPLRADGLAIDTFWGIRKLPHIESHLFSPTVEVPDDADAVLYVAFDNLTINVDGREAIITTSAIGTLRRHSDGQELYKTIVHYQDRDTLQNWTANDNALWRDYANYARYFLGRELAADVFDRVYLKRELAPIATDNSKVSRKDARKLETESMTPTLAWQLSLPDGDSGNEWAAGIDETNIYYDIELFDNHQLVYDAQQIPDPAHTLAYPLDACGSYRWSVRPSYHIDGEVKFGDWMRLAVPDDPKKKKKKKAEDEEQAAQPVLGKGVFGRKASEAPAYIQDFAFLEVSCRR